MSKQSAYLMAALAFLVGFGAGAAMGAKGCPPVPAPAAQPQGDKPVPAKPVAPAPVTSGPEPTPIAAPVKP